MANPDIRVSTCCPSGVTTILPPTWGTRFTHTQISMWSPPDPLARRVEQRGGAGPRHRDRVLLAEVLHGQLGARGGVRRWQVGHQQVPADRRPRPGAGHVARA